MAKKLRVIADVKVQGQSFKGVARVVVPNQSMSLREIVQRFIKKESLPINKDGFYSEDFGDIEKIQSEDITERMDRINDLKEKAKKGKKAEEERLKKEGEDKKKADAEAFRKVASEELDRRTQSQIERDALKKPQGPANSPPS